jgi:hypothetical protein
MMILDGVAGAGLLRSPIYGSTVAAAPTDCTTPL